MSKSSPEFQLLDNASPDNKVKWAFLKFTLGTRQRTLGLVAG